MRSFAKRKSPDQTSGRGFALARIGHEGSYDPGLQTCRGLSRVMVSLWIVYDRLGEFVGTSELQPAFLQTQEILAGIAFERRLGLARAMGGMLPALLDCLCQMPRHGLSAPRPSPKA